MPDRSTDRIAAIGTRSTLGSRLRAITRGLFLFAALAGVSIVGPAPVDAAELVMFDTLGCPWCAAWDRDVGVIYAKTEEGRIAPLRRIDIVAPRPADLQVLEDIVYTPTFVLMDGGVEIGRIVGYPSEDHFWGLFGELLRRLPNAPGS